MRPTQNKAPRRQEHAAAFSCPSTNEVLDGIRDGTANHRSRFYKDITMPFYGFNRPTVKGLLPHMQPIPRAGLPEDIAKASLFLASDDSTFVNGHALVVDGGLTLDAAGPRWSRYGRLFGRRWAFGTEPFSRRPLSRPFGPIIGSTLKGSKGSS